MDTELCRRSVWLAGGWVLLFQILAPQDSAEVDFRDLRWLPVSVVSSLAPSFFHTPPGKVAFCPLCMWPWEGGDEFEGPDFWTPGPVRDTFLFHSFSTIIGVGVGAGAYILSRYAVRN